VTVQPTIEARSDEMDWPIGFWDRFAGSIPDFPDVEDLELEDIEPFA